MPNTKSAEKRHRQSRERRASNRAVRSEIRTRTRRLLSTTDAEDAEGQLQELYSLLDRAAGRGIVHPNTAARQKGRVARHVETLTDG